MVAVSGPLVEKAVRDAVATARLPFSFDQVAVHFDTGGIHLSGRAGVTVLGVTAHGPVETVFRPYPTTDGRLGVALSDTSAAGISLPGGAQDLLEVAVNNELNRTVHLPGYSIADIELSDGALLVYLRVDQP
jgi:hypothetical protein